MELTSTSSSSDITDSEEEAARSDNNPTTDYERIQINTIFLPYYEHDLYYKKQE
jgi:hypothetical protein